MKYLLDTSTVSYVLKGIGNARNRLSEIPPGDVVLSVLTEAELLFGLAKNQQATRLRIAVEEFLSKVAVLDWTSSSARTYAQLRANLELQGRPLSVLDTLIATQALEVGAVIVTSDSAFRCVPNLDIEDW